jgi:magnesium transporter
MKSSSERLQQSSQPSGTPNRQHPVGSGSDPGHSRPTASVSNVTAGITQQTTTNMPVNTPQNPTSRSPPAREQPQQPTATKPKKKNRNRKRRNRRQSFIASEDSGPIVSELSGGLARTNPDQIQERVPFYRGRNLSNTSLESEALLDHR